MHVLAEQVRIFFTALMFLTRIPCPSWVGFQPDWLGRSTVYFPLVGLIVGLLGAAAFWGASWLWPSSVLVAAVAAVAATARVTGAFHEDALADAFDGFGGGHERDRVLEIMKDSRVGSYGALALALAVIARVAALASLAEISPWRVTAALVAGHVLGRWSSLPLIYRYEYARESSGKSKPFAAGVTGPRLAAGTVLTVLIAGTALGLLAIPALLVAALVTALAGRYFRRRIGGITGDCLGAANQIVELATYLCLAAAPLRDVAGFPAGFPTGLLG